MKYWIIRGLSSPRAFFTSSTCSGPACSPAANLAGSAGITLERMKVRVNEAQTTSNIHEMRCANFLILLNLSMARKAVVNRDRFTTASFLLVSINSSCWYGRIESYSLHQVNRRNQSSPYEQAVPVVALLHK